MGRHSKWIWAVVGAAAVAFIVLSGVHRRAKLTAPIVPPPMQPIIVEPIQPSAPTQVPVVPVGPPAGPIAPSAPAVEAAGSAVTTLPQEGTERIKKIQQALQAAGYHPGPVDGKMGRMTQKAIREFQEAQGLSVDGKVGPKTWSKLEAYLHTTTPSAGHD